MDEFFVQVIPQLGSIGPDHPALAAAEAEIVADLRAIAPAVLVYGTAQAVEATKGLTQEFFLRAAELSPVAGAFVRALRIWLERDTRRSVKLLVKDAEGKVIHQAEISGDNISNETLNQLIDKVNWQSD